MSNDLISRQAVIDILEKEMFQAGKNLSKSYLLADVKEQVENLERDYDVEKVIEQLQKAVTKVSFYSAGNGADDRISIDEVIEIVRKGGID